MTIRMLNVGALAATLALGACSDSTEEGPEPAAIELLDGDAQDVPLHHGDAAHPPVLRGLRRNAIDVGHPRDDALGERLREVENLRLGAGDARHSARDLPDRQLTGELPRVQELERARPAARFRPKHASRESGAGRPQ